MIHVIDYGVGNIGSIVNMLSYLEIDSMVADPRYISPKDCSGLILPGVGHFKHAMSTLRSGSMDQAILELVTEYRIPILGICLGMQLLCNSSEEGNVAGLALIDAEVLTLKADKDLGLRVPNMGWASVTERPRKCLMKHLTSDDKFYFVHSFYVKCNNDEDVWLTAKHGTEFTAGFISDNIIGCQFHPEKSHRYGMNLLKNFSLLCEKRCTE